MTSFARHVRANQSLQPAPSRKLGAAAKFNTLGVQEDRLNRRHNFGVIFLLSTLFFMSNSVIAGSKDTSILGKWTAYVKKTKDFRNLAINEERIQVDNGDWLPYAVISKDGAAVLIEVTKQNRVLGNERFMRLEPKVVSTTNLNETLEVTCYMSRDKMKAGDLSSWRVFIRAH